jgi:hypothetical protein
MKTAILEDLFAFFLWMKFGEMELNRLGMAEKKRVKFQKNYQKILEKHEMSFCS